MKHLNCCPLKFRSHIQRAGLGILMIGLVGCASLGAETTTTHPRVRGIQAYVEGWPELTVTEVQLEAEEVRARCAPHAPPGEVGYETLACAEVSLAARTCTVYFPKSPIPEWVLTHERAHCQGGDHQGTLQRAFDQYQAAQRAAVGPSASAAVKPTGG